MGWSMVKIDQGWTVGATYDEISKQHPNLRPFDQLPDREKIRYVKPVEQSLKAMVAWGWTIEMDSARVINKSQIKRKMSKATIGNYQPMPVDLRNVTLTRQMLNMCEKIAEHTHDVWAKAKKEELDSLGGGIHPQLVAYSKLTDRERKKDRDRAQELMRYLQMYGFRVTAPDQIEK